MKSKVSPVQQVYTLQDLAILTGYSRSFLTHKKKAGEISGERVDDIVLAIIDHGWQKPGVIGLPKRKASLPDPRGKKAPQSIEEYDDLIGLPIAWEDATKRERVVGEIERNEIARMETKCRRGELIEVTEAKAECAIVRDELMGVINELPGSLTAILRAALPASQVQAIEVALASVIKEKLKERAKRK